MLRAKLRNLLFVPALALASCAPGDPSVEPVDEADEEMIAGYLPLVGTFVGEPKTAGDFALLVLKTDGTYHAGRFVYCIRSPCPPVGVDGHYQLLRRQARTFIALYDASGRPEYYQYVRRDGHLALHQGIEKTPWQWLHKSGAAWCSVPRDCTLQRLPPGPCVGHYSCEDATCRFSCGFGSLPLAGEPEPCDS